MISMVLPLPSTSIPFDCIVEKATLKALKADGSEQPDDSSSGACGIQYPVSTYVDAPGATLSTIFSTADSIFSTSAALLIEQSLKRRSLPPTEM